MLNVVLRSFRDLIFPPICLHCSGTIEHATAYLCNGCMEKLQLIDPAERCPLCFSSDYVEGSNQCGSCKPNELYVHHIGAAFDYVGPAASIIRQLKYGNQPYLAKGGGAFLVAQFMQLGWPLPDLIVPVPISTTHWLERGYNQSQLLAESFALILDRPVVEILGRKSGDYSQAGMNRKQRNALVKSSFYLKKESEFYDKTILLIDDVMTTGSTLQRCAEVLREGCPKEIYALTCCRAVK